MSTLSTRLRGAPLCAFAFSLLAAPSIALAQTSAQQGVDIVLTPNRAPTSIQNSGSSISVVTAEEIQRANPGGLSDVFRGIPGLDVTETGGVGSTSSVTIRGATVGQTLVLIDGMRVNDPSTPSGEFDFGMLSPTDIERIEVLRGPQSAIYGSDAMGGVINIITRKGAGKPRRSVTLEAGSYGTVSARGAMSGAEGPWRYALSTTSYHSEGFSRYGYRIPRITQALNGPLEKDVTQKIGASLRLGYQANPEFSVDASLSHHWSFLQFDNSFADDPYNKSKSLVTNGQVQARLLTLDGQLTHKLTTFANRTDRFLNFSFGSAFDYRGDRYGAEYQADYKFERFGTFIAGARYEMERLEAFTETLPRGRGLRLKTDNQTMATLSAFALHQVQIGERLDLSFGGRVDSIDRAETFFTWRGTAAYRIVETGTKFRASLGTGAKAPTLYQLFSIYGTPSLSPETSFGFDAGVEQALFSNRVKFGLGVFDNRFRNLINFGNSAICNPGQIFGCYYNVARARTRGVEATISADLLEDRVRLTGTYTFLDAIDETTGLRLTRRAMHQGRVRLDIKATEKLSFQPSLLLMGKRTDVDFDAFYNRLTVQLKSYARFDLGANYKVNDTLSVFARLENILNARYEDVRNYGTPGRSAYGGIRAEW